MNGRVLLYALGVSLFTGILFGMAPARMVIHNRNDGKRTTAGPRVWRFRAGLIAVNVALSALLLVGSGLLVRSFLQLLTVEPGFNPAGLLTLQMDLTGPQYTTNQGITRFYDDLSARIGRLPGVTMVSGATQLPLTGSIDRSGITIEGRPLANPAEAPDADRFAVRPGYFQAMGIPLIRGRVLDERDGTDAPPVAVVGRTMADQLWPGEDAIGQRIRVAGGPNNPMRTIVGIVGDVRHYGLHLPESLQVYVAHAQTHYPESIVSMIVRVDKDRDPLSIASSVREHVRALDPLQPVTKLRTYASIVAESMATRRFTLTLLAAFAVTALILAIVGLYGALSYVISQREREIGVRVALGAESRDIRRLVVRQGMQPAIVGLAIGLVGSFAAGRAIEAMLYGVRPSDATTFGAVLALVGTCALAACLIPARKAAAIDPAVTLRSE